MLQTLPTATRALCGSVLYLLWFSLGLATPDLHAQTGSATHAGPRCFVIEVYGHPEPGSQRLVALVLEQLRRRAGVTSRSIDIGTAGANFDRYRKICEHYRLAPTSTLLYGCGQGVAVPTTPAALRASLDQMLTMTVFSRTGCPHCAAAKAFLGKLQPRYPGLRVVDRDLAEDVLAAADLETLAEHYQQRAVSLPVLHFCNALHVGFDTEATTGRTLEQLLNRWTTPCPTIAAAVQSDDDEVRFADSWRTWAVPRSQRADLTGALSLSALGVEETGPPAVPLATESGDTAPEENGGDLLPLEPTELPEPGPENDVTKGEIELPVFGRIRVAEIGLPLFTLAVGLVDGFNPCAMWVLLFLLSILVNLHDRMKILAVAGTFVAISGLAYFMFMAAWLNVFRLVGLLRPTQISLGVLAVLIGSVHVKDFFALHHGISLSIPEAAKPGIYARVRKIVTAEHLVGAILGAVVLAVLVNIVELLCTAGLPALYTQILSLQKLPGWAEYAYLGLYNIAYMFDDVVMLTIVVVTLKRHKLQEHEGRWLKLVSGLVILLLGLVMIFRPDWLW